MTVRLRANGPPRTTAGKALTYSSDGVVTESRAVPFADLRASYRERQGDPGRDIAGGTGMPDP